MNIAYVRVSTVEQNEGRQKEGLSKYDIDKWFVEKVSAKDMNRPQLNTMLDFAREGDTVYVWDFSRLSRSVQDLLSLVEKFQEKRAGFAEVRLLLQESVRFCCERENCGIYLDKTHMSLIQMCKLSKKLVIQNPT